MNHLILLTPIFLEILLISFLKNPKIIYFILLCIVILYFFTVKKIANKESFLNIVNYTILPIFSTFSIVLFSILIVNRSYVIGMYVANAFFIYFYLRTIYTYFHQKKDYQSYALENFSSYGNFLSFYFISSAIYGLQSFLNTPIWVLMLVVVFYSLIIVYQVMWTNKIDLKKSSIYIFLICLVLLEIAWAISFLTLSYFILGAVLAISYYILIGITRFHLLENLNKRIIKLYLIFGLISIFSILLTAKWI